MVSLSKQTSSSRKTRGQLIVQDSDSTLEKDDLKRWRSDNNVGKSIRQRLKQREQDKKSQGKFTEKIQTQISMGRPSEPNNSTHL